MSGAKAAAFAILQLALIAGTIAWGSHRLGELSAARTLPPLRPEPLTVTPLYDDPQVISDEQLGRVLPRLGQRDGGERTAIGHVDHSLRMWGPRVRFDDPEVMSSADMLARLTDHQRFAEIYGGDRDPLLIDDAAGVRVRALQGPASSSHVDHTLATLAEIGAPLDLAITSPTRRTTLRAIVEQSLTDFSLNQAEYEWSALTYALYLPPVSRWITTEGQEMSFDRLAERIMREDLSRGVCSANHRLYALVIFLRVDDLMRAASEAPILSPEARAAATAFLQDVTDRFVRHQHPGGFWNASWPTKAPIGAESDDRDELIDRLIATGHVLEWWALAPEDLQPPRDVVIAGGQWLVRAIDGFTPQQIEAYQSYLSHAGRALALWRGHLPADVVAGG